MKYGVSLLVHGEYRDIHRMIELALLAREAGWDGFILRDHFAGGVLPQIDSWIAVTVIALSTD